MGSGTYFRGAMELVQILAGAAVAAEYLLEFYFTVRFLLVHGKTEAAAGAAGVWRRHIGQSGDCAFCASKQSGFWRADFFGGSYAVDDSPGFLAAKVQACCGYGLIGNPVWGPSGDQ